GAARIGHQRNVADVRVAADARHHRLRVAQVRHRIGRDERGRFDLGDAGFGEPVDELDLLLGGNELRLDLKAVAGDDVVDIDALHAKLSWCAKWWDTEYGVDQSLVAGICKSSLSNRAPGAQARDVVIAVTRR